MKWPLVSRATAEVWERSSHAWAKQCEGLLDLLREKDQRADRFLEQLLAMKREGFATQPKAIVRESAPDLEGTGLERAEAQRRTQVRAASDREFIDNATNDLVQRGADRGAAEREARRLLEESRAQDPASH